MKKLFCFILLCISALSSGIQGSGLFIKNMGQMPEDILYYANVSGGRLYIRKTDLVFQAIRHEEETMDISRMKKSIKTGRMEITNLYIVFPDSSFSNIKENNAKKTVYNFFLRNDEAGWVRDVPTFSRLTLEDIYPGVDLVFEHQACGNFWHFNTESPDRHNMIPLAFLDSSKDIKFNDDSFSFYHGHTVRIPYPYMMVNNKTVGTHELFCGRLHSNEKKAGNKGTVIIAQDLSQLIWGTYVGGSHYDDSASVAVDSEGSVVFGGRTGSTDIPTPNGYDQTHNFSADMYIGKLDSTGSQLLWGTYIGGSLHEYCHALVIDDDDNVIIVGEAYSEDMPVPNGYDTSLNGIADIYAAKLNKNGNDLIWGTYIGGSGGDSGDAVALNSDGNIIITGGTTSHDIPVPNGFDTTYNGHWDIYTACLASNGDEILWASYLGGSNWDYAFGIAVDSQDDIIVGGVTKSYDIPAYNGYNSNYSGNDFDFYIAKISSDGSQLLWATYIGGSGEDLCWTVAVDSSDNVFAGGQTNSPDLPVPNSYDPYFNGLLDIYIAKLNPSGNELLSATYIGGSLADTVYSLAFDSEDNLILGGWTSSLNIPVPNAYDPTRNGPRDIYIGKLSNSGDTLLWATYLGGSRYDTCFAITVDQNDDIIVSGYTTSSDIPTPNGFDTTYNGANFNLHYDIYNAKINPVFTLPKLLNTYRFFNTVSGGHLYTISILERDHIIANLPQWNYEGPKFGVKFGVYHNYSDQTSPTYRFFNTNTGIHFYTISEYERDIVMQLPGWDYEGIKFYVYSAQVQGTIPVYRFFNNVHGGHLYTVCPDERETVMQLPHWTYEGIPFYVFPLIRGLD